MATQSFPSLVPNRVSSLQLEEPRDIANRYLIVIFIVTNDTLQELQMQDDHPSAATWKDPSKESGWFQSGHQREDEPCERGLFFTSGHDEDAATKNKTTEASARRPNNRCTGKWLDNGAAWTCYKIKRKPVFNNNFYNYLHIIISHVLKWKYLINTTTLKKVLNQKHLALGYTNVWKIWFKLLFIAFIWILMRTQHPLISTL